MSSHSLNRLQFSPLAMAVLLFSGSASAQISDTIHPFVSLGYTYDDNLLRLPDDVSFDGQRSDRARQAQAGILVERPIGRQKLTGYAKVTRVTFDHLDQLDYNAKDVSADLAWELGNRLSGHLGGLYTESLTPFSDYHVDERNLRTQRNAHVDGAWRFHPSWQVRGGYVRNKFTYELQAQSVNDRTEDLAEVGVDYLAHSGSRVGLVARRLEGRYDNPRRFGNIVLDDDYTQDELKLNVNWLLSGVTQVTVLAGYAKRKHGFFESRDSSGANGRISVRWSPTGKLSFNADAWREFAAVENTLVTSSLNRGASLRATWNISSKLQATASTRRENREFEEQTNVVFNGEARDRIRGSTIGLVWAATKSIQLSASAFHDQRSGAAIVGNGDYRANGVSLNATAQF
ncbi:exopolysaccharide biosynthesis operon protein EpsL [Pseudoduganella lurida]|uniref:Exopolysaccharide biosynthesis operon protein EpsL n=1 Tax=Pseudoduganella lurida TaxID=1036180 RepID=A0A562R8E2_9BURK|nr:XrtB/PEP-CTERM-associated polysaccharide biosynthesis outer membrane protein EpsL [Pseudoduganella lurida]TWI65153.1 exopolysaccharide biosynthesis operon protein EpsL [Pseudoduganella lurida]